MIRKVKKFAWLPVKLKSGRWVWLRHYVRKSYVSSRF